MNLNIFKAGGGTLIKFFCFDRLLLGKILNYFCNIVLLFCFLLEFCKELFLTFSRINNVILIQCSWILLFCFFFYIASWSYLELSLEDCSSKFIHKFMQLTENVINTNCCSHTFLSPTPITTTPPPPHNPSPQKKTTTKNKKKINT